jgi:hypothetical protein
MADYTVALFEQHAAMLAESGIPPEHAAARGYVSVDTKVRLEGIGVTKAGRNVPGLLVPQLRKDGSTWGYQYRPDVPRMNGKDQPVKYETPVNQRNGIDVPPGVGPRLDDPAVPLFVTEGVKKADAAAVRGLACVALPGVWSWRGKNGHGGKTAVADWHDVALDGRRVILAFDSDVTAKKPVRRALDELAGYLATKGASIEYAHLPELGDGKCGLDDFLVASSVDELWSLVRPDPPATIEPDPEPKGDAQSPSPVPPRTTFTGNPAALLDQVHQFLRAYVAWPSDAAAVAITLWAAHTHMVTAFESTPRLALLSPEKQCGKTRVLELLELLCVGTERLNDASAAYMFRRIGEGGVTIALDEADTIWKRGKADESAEALRSIVNAGHRQGSFVGRAHPTSNGIELVRFPVYAPVALAGIGNCLPDTILDRAVIVQMRRRAPDERVAEFRARTTGPEGRTLGTLLAAWAADAADKVGNPWPMMPDDVTDRAADVWEPLLMVADLAGGHWPDKARDACVGFVTGAREDTASVGIRLLGDLLAVFRDDTNGEIASALWSKTILDRLHAMPEAPWGDWYGKPLNERGLAKLLKPYRDGDGKSISSKDVRLGETNRKGYYRADLWDAWVRYGVLTTPSATSATSATALASPVADVADVADVPVPVNDDPYICDCGNPLDQHAASDCDAPVVHRPPDLWSTP